VVARVCCIFAAWIYFVLALDIGITRLGHRRSDSASSSALGVLVPLAWMLGADATANPFWGEMAVDFAVRVTSLLSQERLFELLSRREVILRLIGAERVMAQTLCLLLRGVTVACGSWGSSPVAEFLARAAPSAPLCVAVVALRRQAVVLGATFALAPQVMTGEMFGSPLSFIFGLLAGAYAANAVLTVWYSHRAELESPALRLALLVPGGVSSQAKELLRVALVGARTRAVRMMTRGLIERLLRYLWVSRL